MHKALVGLKFSSCPQGLIVRLGREDTCRNNLKNTVSAKIETETERATGVQSEQITEGWPGKDLQEEQHLDRVREDG